MNASAAEVDPLRVYIKNRRRSLDRRRIEFQACSAYCLPEARRVRPRAVAGRQAGASPMFDGLKAAIEETATATASLPRSIVREEMSKCVMTDR